MFSNSPSFIKYYTNYPISFECHEWYLPNEYEIICNWIWLSPERQIRRYIIFTISIIFKVHNGTVMFKLSSLKDVCASSSLSVQLAYAISWLTRYGTIYIVMKFMLKLCLSTTWSSTYQFEKKNSNLKTIFSWITDYLNRDVLSIKLASIIDFPVLYRLPFVVFLLYHNSNIIANAIEKNHCESYRLIIELKYIEGIISFWVILSFWVTSFFT